MGRPLIDLTGRRFGRLTVVHRAENYRTEATWFCSCDCGGTLRATVSSGLRDGRTISCGCHQRETVAALRRTHGETVGRRRSPEHQAWLNLIARCEGNRPKDAPYYRDRGITVCPKWRASFTAFLADVGRRPAPEMSIDRINVNGNYEPGNVRWATPIEQANNKQRNAA